ncbi:MAG: hypothetical protein RLZZ385_2104 [Pseudomonadota bacterium]|jgi:hypothetical protein
MPLKPVVLIYDLNNTLVDDVAALLGSSGRFTTINTYNETNAMEVVHQYDRLFGLLTNRLSCIITGWNNYKKRRDQFLFRLRQLEAKSPLRKPTPVIVITEDHLEDLMRIALDPTDGNVAAYLHVDDFAGQLMDILNKIVFEDKSRELNSIAYARVMQEEP